MRAHWQYTYLHHSDRLQSVTAINILNRDTQFWFFLSSASLGSSRCISNNARSNVAGWYCEFRLNLIVVDWLSSAKIAWRCLSVKSSPPLKRVMVKNDVLQVEVSLEAAVIGYIHVLVPIDMCDSRFI